MSKEYRFENITEFLNLDAEKFERMVIDLRGWYKVAKEINDLKLPIPAPKFIWVDNDRGGEISKMVFTNGEKDIAEIKIHN